MEEKYFPRLLDPRGIRLDHVVQLLSDLVHGKASEDTKLVKALADFNINASGRDKDSASMYFASGQVICVNISSKNTSGRLDGYYINENGDQIVGTFPVSLVEWVTAKDWSVEDLINYYIIPKTHKLAKKKIFTELYRSEKRKKKRSKYFVLTDNSDNVYEVVSSLVTKFKGQNFDEIYIWWDAFCLNQSLYRDLKDRHKSLFKDFLFTKYPRFYQKFRQGYVFMSSLNKPNVLTSLLKVNLVVNIIDKKVPFEVLLSKRESSRVENNLYHNYKDFVSKLFVFKIRNLISDKTDSLVDKLLSKEIKKRKREDKIDKAINEKFLLLTLGQHSISMWYKKKKNCEKKHKDQLAIGLLSNHIALQIYYDLKWIDLAKLLLLYSAKCYTNVFGVHHKFVATCFLNIGLIHVQDNAYKKSERYLEKSVQLLRKHRDNSVEYMIGLSVYCSVLKKLGKEDERLEDKLHELVVETKRYSSEHLETIRVVHPRPRKLNNSINSVLLGASFNNLGLFLQNKGRFNEATVVYREALRILRTCCEASEDNKVGSVSYKLLPKVYTNYGTLQERKGKMFRAVTNYSKGLFLFNNNKSVNELDEALTNLAVLLTAYSEVDTYSRSNLARTILKRKSTSPGLRALAKELAQGSTKAASKEDAKKLCHELFQDLNPVFLEARYNQLS